MRNCGSCGLCCKLPALTSFEKPGNTWCQHYEKGKGCAIYDSRPEECRLFRCFWIAGALPGSLKPLKTGVIAHIDQKHGLLLQEDEHAQAVISFKDQIEAWRAGGLDVSIIKFGGE
jgi:Fe-S-cluster containining protein